MNANVGWTALAVVPVRQGALPAGGIETAAEAGGRVLLIGSGVDEAADGMLGIASETLMCEAGDFAPARWAAYLAPVLADEPIVILPASPDGRDLAPRLAASLGREWISSAIRVDATRIETVTYGGRAVEERTVQPGTEMVVTFQPGARTVRADPMPVPSARTVIDLPEAVAKAARDAVVEKVLPPDVSTMDLSEAPRLLGGGAGLVSSEKFDQLARVAESLGAAMGATRVITDKGWLGHDRQIGTTGVVVDPALYLAFGISGAVQHTAGLGNPEHIVSVNIDEHCPMMEMADLAIVADANETLEHLERLIADGEIDHD